MSFRRKECKEGTLDQWFTKSTHLVHYSQVVSRHVGQERLFVDSSCGTGELGLFLARLGIRVKMYDVDATNLTEAVQKAIQEGLLTFEAKSWFEVTAEDLGNQDFAMGFNPPFGHKGKISKQFAEHALALGASMICWISPNIRGAGGRQWLPPDFVEKHREDVPKNAFVKDKKSVSANTNFVIFEKDPGGHVETLEAWKIEDARELPEGWYLERLSARLGGSVEATLIENFPKEEGEFMIRTSMSNAGESGITWSQAEGYRRLNSDGVSHPFDPLEKHSVTQHCIIGLPRRYQGKRRVDFLKQVAPMFKARRRRACNKAGINFLDIRKVIFELEKNQN